MSESDTRPPPGGGKKILGLPRPVAIFVAIALVAGVGWYLIRKRQSGSSSTTATTGQDYSGDISTLQTEFGDLASELAAMQGQGQGSGGSAGGGTPVIVGSGPTGTTGTTDTSGTTADGSSNQAAGQAPAPKPKPKRGPRPKAPAERDAHQDHMQHLAHERHLAHLAHERRR